MYRKSLEIIETRGLSNDVSIFDLVENCPLTPNDCYFVALAMEMKLPLLTEDKKILREFPETAVSMKDYI